MTDLASLVRTYGYARGLAAPTHRDGVHYLGLGDQDDHHRLFAAVRRVGPDGAYVSVDVRSRQRVPREQWGEAMSSCNLWNARMRLPKAWLDTDGSGADAPVVLEGCVPGSTLTQGMFDRLADGVLVGGRRFWRWVDVHASW